MTERAYSQTYVFFFDMLIRHFVTISIDVKQIDLEEIVSVAEQTEKKREEEKPTNKNAAVIEVFGSDSDEFSDVSNILSWCPCRLVFSPFFFSTRSSMMTRVSMWK